METVKIVTDSTSDIPAEWLRELDITVLPCSISFGIESFREGIDLSTEEFYRKMAGANTPPTTSRPPFGLYSEVFERLGRDGASILSIHISSQLSGIYRDARESARNLSHLKITVIDSRQLSMGLGWQVVLAARAAREGRGLNEIADMVRSIIPRVRAVTVLDTLEYVARGGRIGKAASLVGTLLSVKPIVQVLDGEVSPVGRVRSKRQALEYMVDYIVSQGPFEEMAVLHANAPETAYQVLEILLHRARAAGIPLERESILVSKSGASITTHLGLGAVGICCVLAK
ncbi:MAG: DegV family protein [Anaerolineae bacterium]